MKMTATAISQSEISFDGPEQGRLLVRLQGPWTLDHKLPPYSLVTQTLESGSPVSHIAFDTQGLKAWDSGLITFLVKVVDRCKQDGIDADWSGLPPGVQRLLTLAYAVPERKGARKGSVRESLLPRIGMSAIEAWRSGKDIVSFVGEAFIALMRFLRGKARFRGSDFVLILQEVGALALPIVSLISVLVGLILAYVGAVQLQQFGAQIYVANLVGLGMTREMGAMMTAVIMAGRTGAAFAAQLGTMQVNEEIDALKTMGISPMEFLVLPRMLALILMMPLLAIYANLMGILGGAFIGVTVLNLSAVEYFTQTQSAIGLTDLSMGLIKAAVFGVLVAVAGCMRGLQCGRSASAVGIATTSAVVTGIVLIIVFDSLLTVIYDVLGI